MADQPSEKILVEELALQRLRMSAQINVLRHKLDVPGQLKSSLSTHPTAWFVGAAVVGFLLAQIPRSRGGHRDSDKHSRRLDRDHERERPRESKAEVKTLKGTLMLLVLKSAADYAKPALMEWVRQRLTQGQHGRGTTAAAQAQSQVRPSQPESQSV